MMTKDKKPFTYTPGGLDLSEIKSPRMQRRINRNAGADEIHGEPAPTTVTNQLSPSAALDQAVYYQSPPSYLPARGMPPPPPPLPAAGNASPNPPPPPPPASAQPQVPKPSVSPHRPPQGGFDPNEILARANRNQNAEPKQNEYQNNSYYNEPAQKYNTQYQEPEYQYEPKQAQNDHSFGSRINEPGHIYVPQIAPKLQNEPGSIYVPTVPNSSPSPRGQLGSIYIPPVTNMNEVSLLKKKEDQYLLKTFKTGF